MKEVITEYQWFYTSDNGLRQGPYVSLHLNGNLHIVGNYVDGEWCGHRQEWFDNGNKQYSFFLNHSLYHGEFKSWHESGVMWIHCYYVDDVNVHDFLKKPLSDEERMLLVLKYGAPLLPKGDAC